MLAWQHIRYKAVVYRNGIQSILTTPQTLTVDVINKYLELKARYLLN